MLELKPHFSSARFELLPYLVRKQFLPKSNIPVPPGAAPASDPPSCAAAPSGNQFKMELQMSAGHAARRAFVDGSDFRCCCYILPHDAGYCVRANELKAYVQANLDVSRGGVTEYEKASEAWVEDSACAPKEGNFVLKSFSADCSRGEGIEVGQRTSIKKSSVGPHCRIGSNVRLTNCILMDHVVVGDKVNMSNCVICADAEVQEGASLKDVQVAKGVTIEPGAVVKGDAVTTDGGGGGLGSSGGSGGGGAK